MNSGSFSTNQMSNAANDTAISAPKVRAIIRARSVPSRSVVSKPASETARY
jgi:hypothetical protein